MIHQRPESGHELVRQPDRGVLLSYYLSCWYKPYLYEVDDDDDDDDDDGQRLHKTILMKGFMKVRFKRFCNPPLVAGVRAVVTVITMPRSETERVKTTCSTQSMDKISQGGSKPDCNQVSNN